MPRCTLIVVALFLAAGAPGSAQTGAFRDTFVYEPHADAWYFRLEAADSAGAWRLFAEYNVRRN